MGQVSKSGRVGFARLSLTTLAALTPSEHQVTIHDARISEPDYDGDWDLVGFTAMTAEVPDAYRMADEFRRRGRKVVIGGYHATGLPEEASQHADAVVAGEGEKVWPQLLHDLANGGFSRRIYQAAEFVDMRDMPIPCRHLLDRERFTTFATIQTTRGCPYGCDFCSVTNFFGGSFRHRPVDDVIAELRSLPEKSWMFLDDNLTGDTRYAKELFRAMIPLGLNWGAQASSTLTRDPELMDLYARAGGKYVFIGYESVTGEILKAVHKGFNRPEGYIEGIRQLHRRGIAVMGSFIFGLDGDDLGVFKRTVDFVNSARIDASLYGIMTPFPGTRLHERLRAEGRIHDHDWAKYDTCNSVIHPKGMTSDELQEGWAWAYRETYKWTNVLKRILRPDPGFKYRLILSYSYARKAYRYCPPPPHPERFSRPCLDPPAVANPSVQRTGTGA